MAVLQLLSAEVGRTHASSVMPVVRSRSAASATVTMSFVPSKLSAPPFLPAAVQLAPETIPEWPLPVASDAVEPAASSNP